MKKEEYLKILKEAIEEKDIEIWNKWRYENPYAHISLECINLCEESLGGVHLLMANLSGANLRGANLCEANLYKTDLRKADLFDANFSKADISGVNLQDTDVIHTNLRGANLTYANLRGANFCNTDLTDANLTLANIKWANLKDNVSGIEPHQVKSASFWKNAFYDPAILEKLGLPSDHNENVQIEKIKEEDENKSELIKGGLMMIIFVSMIFYYIFFRNC